MKLIRYITALLLTIAVSMALCILEIKRIAILTEQQGSIAEIKDIVSELQVETETASTQDSQRDTRIDELTAQVRLLREDIDRTADKQNRGGDRLVSLGMWKRTGYCSCEKCCGKWALNRPGGIVYGRDGKTELIEDVSVAADLPVGTKLMIDGNTYIVHDIPAERVIKANGGKIVDLYCGCNHKKAWYIGNEKVEVFLLEAVR